MRILIAVHHFPPSFGSGAVWRAHRTAHGLQQAGHQVQVVCAESITHGDGQTLERVTADQDGIVVHRLYFNLPQSPDAVRRSFCNPLVGQQVSDLIAAFRPDVLHLISGYLMSGSTIEAAQAAGVPTVVTLTDFWFLCPRITLVRSDGSLCPTPAQPRACTLCLRKEKRRYLLADRWSGGGVGWALSLVWKKYGDALLAAMHERRHYLLSLLNTIDVVISPSQFLKELFQAEKVAPRRFLYMRQGLDVSHWLEAAPCQDDTHLRIGYIGQIAAHKGVNVLVRAFQRLQPGRRKPRLILYGDVEQFPRFARRIRQELAGQDQVTWGGTFEHTKIRQIHAGLDVLVVPSVWYENSPNVILEAFACGTPVVVSRLGGMAELVDDGVNGFHFEPGNAAALARVLQRFVDEPNLGKALRQGMPPVKMVQQEIQELERVYTSPEVN